jgi:hypothetical protein
MKNRCIRNDSKPLAASKEDEGRIETLRAYQMEMLQFSIDGNIIVVVSFGDLSQSNSLS